MTQRNVWFREPLPVLILYLLLGLGFFIYIPVALFHSNSFLLLQDCLLFVGVISTALSRLEKRRLFGGNSFIIIFLFLFLFSLISGVILDPLRITLSTIQGLRSLLFGILVLVLSSFWLNSQNRVNHVLKIIVIGSIFSVLYGFKQLIFGLLPFELEHLASMGSSLAEVDKLNRLRVPSVFGDSAAFAFVILLATPLYLVGQHRQLFPFFRTPPRHFFIIALLIFGLGVTLTRAPMVGLAVTFFILYLINSKWTVNRWLKLFGLVFVFTFLLLVIDYIVVIGILAQSDLKSVQTINNVLTSVWTLLPRVLSGDISYQLESLRGLSVSSRSESWREGIGFLMTYPFGGGIGNITEGGHGLLSFSPVDVGILRYGLELGWLGFISMIGLFIGIAFTGWINTRKVVDESTKLLGRYLFSLWVGICTALSITSFLHTEILAIMVWVLGGIMLNLDQISMSGRVFLEREAIEA